MRLEELLARLPGNEQQPGLMSEQVHAFDTDPAGTPNYVAPTLTVVDWPDNAPTVLIEAAGAVGKSAAAAVIAQKLNWPLVRAEEAQVGSYSLSGLVQDALGFSSTYLQEIAQGTAGIVIDSLDEAHFKAGTDNFLAFLENVHRVAGFDPAVNARQATTVLLSRSDTAEYVRLAFGAADVPLAHLRLDFFDLVGAHKFIEAYMTQRFNETQRGEYNLPRANPNPFAKLRDQRFNQIARVLVRQPDVMVRDVWAQVRDFLGYTPVLIALAESLAVKNPVAERAALTADDQNVLLLQIIDHILQREHRKFSDQLRPRLQATLPMAEERDVVAASMYTPYEQCARLLALTTESELATALPATLPQSVRGMYEEAVQTFLSDHPFIKGRQFASVVFGDFVAAVACQQLEVKVALRDRPQRMIGSVGPFFARFLSHSEGRSAERMVPEDLLERLIESWTQEAELVGSSSSIVASLGGGASSVMCFRDDENSDVSVLEFAVTELSGALHLTRPAKRLTLVTDQGLILGTKGQQLLLGPEVLLVGDEIVIEAESIRIDTESGTSGGLVLAGRSLLANYLSKVECGPDDLDVYIDEPPPRLRGYKRRLNAGARAIPFQRYLDLRTILTSFRPSVRGGPSVLAAKIDGKIVKDNLERQQVLGHLMKCGLVKHRGTWYELDPNVFSTLGFGLQHLKSGQPSEAVVRFLDECIRDGE